MHFWLVLQLKIDHVTTYFGPRAELQANLGDKINFMSAYIVTFMDLGPAGITQDNQELFLQDSTHAHN